MAILHNEIAQVLLPADCRSNYRHRFVRWKESVPMKISHKKIEFLNDMKFFAYVYPIIKLSVPESGV